MNNQQAQLPIQTSVGEIIALDVAEEVFMRDYMGGAYEWVAGVIYKMSPVTSRHDALTRYFAYLFGAYLDLKSIGQLRSSPFVIRTQRSFRSPDIMYIANDNPHPLTDTAMQGPADIVIEVVSPESSSRDYGDKMIEYEALGVREYWIIDPLRQQATFHRLQDNGTYSRTSPEDNYTTAVLPNLQPDIPTLWQETLPGLYAVADAVRAMLTEG
jgi:Uma2 family endonuclease